MVHTEIDYQKLFSLFVSTDPLKESLKTPSKQNGIYYASDGMTMIMLKESPEWILPFNVTDKPDFASVVPRDRNQPVKIDLIKLAKEIEEKLPLVDEYKNSDVKCTSCDGEGVVECDLGHEHDCPVCDGEGVEEEPVATGKKVKNTGALLRFLNIGFRYPILKRLIDAGALIGVTTCTRIYGEDNKANIFKVGEFTVLLMPFLISENYPDDELIDITASSLL